jgi:hypothetical protein
VAALGRGMSWRAWGWVRCVPQLKTAFNKTSVPRPAVTAVVPVILDMLILCSSVVSKRPRARGSTTSASCAVANRGPLWRQRGNAGPAPECGWQRALTRVRRRRGCAQWGAAITEALHAAAFALQRWRRP